MSASDPTVGLDANAPLLGPDHSSKGKKFSPSLKQENKCDFFHCLLCQHKAFLLAEDTTHSSCSKSWSREKMFKMVEMTVSHSKKVYSWLSLMSVCLTTLLYSTFISWNLEKLRSLASTLWNLIKIAKLAENCEIYILCTTAHITFNCLLQEVVRWK